MSNETPRKIGQYELRKVLGRGGMATVWRAYQPNLDREVAIKIMAGQFSDNEDFLKRFTQEARSIARLRHPYILAVYDYGQADNDQPYIVTELMDGGTLREYMTRQRLDLKEVSRILSQIADALDYAHTQGMVHRDIKPSNILMGTQRVFGDRAVLSDFGIVKLLANTNITQTGVGIGTPEYMSPEQAAGERLDGRSDEYSLGIVLYEMLTGVTPYKADTPLAVMMGHVNRPLPDPRTFNPNLSQAVVEVLVRALAKYPQERYESAGAFADAFAEAVGANKTVQTVGPTPRPTPSTPTPTSTGSNRLNTSPGFITSAQAYDYALMQERQGNRQAAFETLSDLERREPNYRDVLVKLKDYQAQNYQYSGNHTLFRPVVGPGRLDEATKALNVGPLKSQTVSAPYVPTDPTAPGAALDSRQTQPEGATTIGDNQARPTLVPSVPVVSGSVGAAGSKKSSRGLVIGIVVGVVALLVVAGLIVALTSGKKDTTTTAVAANPTATLVVTVGGPTTGPASSTGPAITTVVTTQPPQTSSAPATTAAPTTPAERADPLRDQITPVVTQMYKPEGNLKEGVAKLKDLAKTNKDSWLVQRELGRAYYWYVRDGGGLPYLKQATDLNPQDALGWAYLALAYADNFDDTEAQTAIRQALDLAPNSAEVRAASAITFIRGSSQQARQEVTRAIGADKDNLLVNYAAWAVYQSANDFSTSLPYLDSLLDKHPSFASLFYSKGYHYDRQGDTANALLWYNKALAIDPDFPLAHTGLGQAARLKGDLKTAAVEYQKAIAVYDNDVNALVGLGYTQADQQQGQDAIVQFRKALKLDKNNPEAHNGLAGVYLAQAKAIKDKDLANKTIDLALTELDAAIAASPNYANAYYNQGAAHFLKGEFVQAEAPFKKAIELDAKNALYFYSLGANYFRLNDKASAKQNLRQALSLDPTFKPAQDLLNQIGN